MTHALSLALLAVACIGLGWWLHAFVAAYMTQRHYARIMSKPGATEFDVKLRNWNRMVRDTAGWR